jgi:hypothetical protein
VALLALFDDVRRHQVRFFVTQFRQQTDCVAVLSAADASGLFDYLVAC